MTNIPKVGHEMQVMINIGGGNFGYGTPFA
jgi:hypothetical protein